MKSKPKGFTPSRSVFKKKEEKSEKAVLKVEDQLSALDEIESSLPFISVARPSTKEFFETHHRESEKILEVKKKVRHKLIENVDVDATNWMSDEERRKFFKDKIIGIVDRVILESRLSLTRDEKSGLYLDIQDDVLGLGPLEQLIRDDDITEIMVNGPNQIFVERKGSIEDTPLSFLDTEHLTSIIRRIISPLGRRIDESSPLVDARLADGSRVNAVISPTALDGPILTIRKFSKEPIQMIQLLKWGALNAEIANFISACVRGGLNIFISGGTGSGKTTLLNLLGTFIPPGERIVTIEDAAELRLKSYHKHVVRMETRPPNIEGKGEITIQNLVKNALRMRPDRIVVGEVRGKEAYDMLQAMNTGHDGSMSTGHANSPDDMLSRLESMVMSGQSDVPIYVIRKWLSSALDLILQVERLPDGSRRLTYVTEIGDLNEQKEIITHDVFRFRETGLGEEGKIQGCHEFTGRIPVFIDALKKRGIEINLPTEQEK